jgi:HEAT repeat protein
MKKKLFIGAILLLGVAATVGYFWLARESRYNPRHNGKRVYDWKDQAIFDPDPAARREATENLIQAFRQMERGEPRVQLVLKCSGERELPKEMLPFLLEALHAHEIQDPCSYQAMTLSRVEDAAALPALIEVIRLDDDAHARAGAVAALGMMGAKARAVEAEVRAALADPDHRVRKEAEQALREITRPR